ncbi:MAG: MmcQ/YjbR family DNA-binding protein [Acidobacteriota bacterium]
MTADDFGKIALGLPGAEQRAHMGHPDFRAAGKIFAGLGSPDKGSGVVKLTPEQQAEFMRAEPEAFAPAAGAWGRSGWTVVQLQAAAQEIAGEALTAAWRNVASKTAGKPAAKKRTGKRQV